MAVSLEILNGFLRNKSTRKCNKLPFKCNQQNMQVQPQIQAPAMPGQGQIGGQATVIQVPNNQINQSSGKPMAHMMGNAIKILGIIQVIIGSLCITFSIAGIGMHTVFSNVGHGIWCSVFFILAGVFAILAGTKRHQCYVVTCLILTIIAAVFAVPMIALASIGWAEEHYNDYYYVYVTANPSCCRHYSIDDFPADTSCCYNGYSDYDTKNLHEREAMSALLVFLAIIDGILAIITSALSCHAACCGPRQVPPVHYMQTAQGLQMIVIQGQPGSQQAVPLMSQPQGYNPQIGNAQGAPMMNPGGQQPPPPQQMPAQPFPPPAYTAQQPPVFNSQQPQPLNQPQMVPGGDQYGVKM